MEEPSPAACWMSTSCPERTSSVTPAGVSATRYSWFLTSFGTPTRMVPPSPQVCGGTVPDDDGASPTTSWAARSGRAFARTLTRRRGPVPSARARGVPAGGDGGAADVLVLLARAAAGAERTDELAVGVD